MCVFSRNFFCTAAVSSSIGNFLSDEGVSQKCTHDVAVSPFFTLVGFRFFWFFSRQFLFVVVQ